MGHMGSRRLVSGFSRCFGYIARERSSGQALFLLRAFPQAGIARPLPPEPSGRRRSWRRIRWSTESPRQHPGARAGPLRGRHTYFRQQQIWPFPLLRFPICLHAESDTHPAHPRGLSWPCGAWGCLLWAVDGFAGASSHGTIVLETGFGACGAGGGATYDLRCEREW